MTQEKHLRDALIEIDPWPAFVRDLCALCGKYSLGRALCHSVTQDEHLWDARVRTGTGSNRVPDPQISGTRIVTQRDTALIFSVLSVPLW